MKSKLMLAMAMAAVLAVVAVPAATAQKSFDQTQPVKPDGVVQISNVAGAIRVVLWEKPEVHVSGELEEKVERVDFEVRDGRTSIRVVIPQRGGNKCAAYLTISVPSASSIDIDAVSADVKLDETASPELERPMRQSVVARSVSGDVEVVAWASLVELKSVSGDVTFSGAAETANLETTSGNIECAGAHSADGHTISGDIEISNADSVKFRSTSGDLTAVNIGKDAEAASVSGDVELAVVSMNKVSARTVSGEVVIQGALAPAGRVTAATQSGGVTIRFPLEVSAEFDINTMSGQVRTEFGIRSEGAHHGLDFALGSGDGYVRVSTMSGNVSIEKL